MALQIEDRDGDDATAFAALSGTVLFTHHGSFSRSNEQLVAAIGRLAPRLRIASVDTRKLLTSWRFVPLLLRLLLEKGPFALRSKRLLKYHLLRSVTFWRAARALVDRRARDLSPPFTLQTQSLFDASLGDVPHGIYTDFASRGSKWSDWNRDLRPDARWAALEYPLYRRADRVFTFGSRVRDLIVEEYGADPARVFRAGAGPNVTTFRDYSRQRAHHILFVGVEWERKGGPELLDAFRRLKARLPQATLTIVGCTPKVDDPAVAVLGRQPPQRVAACFNEAACFCMPSRLEPFGVVYVEALYAGLPIVATDCGDQFDVIEEGRNGFVVPLGDVQGLAERLYDVLAEPARTRRMGEESLRLAPQFTWDAAATVVLREMLAAVDARGGRRAAARS